MVVNPLFQSYRKQEGFNVQIVNNRNTTSGSSGHSIMAHTSRDQPGGKRDASYQEHGEGKPESKRRRLHSKPQADETGDWDDSFELTQQDLESLDVVASQAIVEPSTSKQETEADQTLELESTSFAVTAPGGSGFFQAPAPGATVRLKNRMSTSSSSDSTYPHSSASFRKTPSSDVSSVAGSLTSKSNSGRSSGELSVGETTVMTPAAHNNGGAAASIVTITALREELRTIKDQGQKARSEVYAKDGQVKFLKDSLHKQELELEKLRAERDERKESEAAQQKEREKELKQQVEKLTTQIHFKAQDCVGLQQRCQALENKLGRHQSSSPSVAQPSTSTAGVVTASQPQGSPDKSPKVRKVLTKGQRTPDKGGFPSHQSFMAAAADLSPRPAARSTHSRETMTTDDWQPTSRLPCGARARGGHQRRLGLRVPCPGGRMPGSQLVSGLLRCGGGETEDTGVLGLLQTLPSRLDLESLQYQRDGATARLSPVKKPRRQVSPERRSTPQQQQQTAPASHRPIVDRVNFFLAAQGLRDLIDSSGQHTEPLVPSTTATTTTTVPTPPSPPPHCGAVLLLPMLNDYVTHYIDILSTGPSTAAATTAVQSPNLSSTGSKSSCDTGSSLESLTSSLGVLLRQGAEYANSLETLTVCALRVLRLLVGASAGVRALCLHSSSRGGDGAAPRLLLPPPATDTSSSTIETDQEKEKVATSLRAATRTQGAEYANSLETLTVCALRVLRLLVGASAGVRALCLHSSSRGGEGAAPRLLLPPPATDTSSSTIETNQEKEKTNESGIEGDDEQSTASSRNSSVVISSAGSLGSRGPPVGSLASPSQGLQGLNLLLKIVRLASPSRESSGFKQSIVEAALDVLIALATISPDAAVNRLHVVVLRGVLTECLQLDQQSCITVRALDLFSSLARCPTILPFLCSKTDVCTLLNVHMVSTRLLATSQGKQEVNPLMLAIISKVIDSVSSVASFHRNGIHVLTNNNCRCSGQIVPSLVHALFYLLRDYQMSHSQHVFAALRQGVLLLHDISLRDANFQQRHAQVHLHYSALMSGLTTVYKDCKDSLPPVEASALEDLWEDADESDSGSQDSDQEEAMEAQ